MGGQPNRQLRRYQRRGLVMIYQLASRHAQRRYEQALNTSQPEKDN